MRCTSRHAVRSIYTFVNTLQSTKSRSLHKLTRGVAPRRILPHSTRSTVRCVPGVEEGQRVFFDENDIILPPVLRLPEGESGNIGGGDYIYTLGNLKNGDCPNSGGFVGSFGVGVEGKHPTLLPNSCSPPCIYVDHGAKHVHCTGVPKQTIHRVNSYGAEDSRIGVALVPFVMQSWSDVMAPPQSWVGPQSATATSRIFFPPTLQSSRAVPVVLLLEYLRPRLQQRSLQHQLRHGRCRQPCR
jgi:hypothetical protein